MYIFRGARKRFTGGELLSRLRQSGEGLSISEAKLRRLLAAGDLECAIADYVCAANDHEPPILGCARARLLSAAAQFISRNGSTRQNAAMTRHKARMDSQLDSWVRCRNFSLAAAEGFRFYALHPSVYAATARRWRDEHLRQSRAWVLGMRTIGSTLGAVAAAELAAAGMEIRFSTLRPRGLPDNRYYRWTKDFEKLLLAWPGDFLLADEGPGLSGSSFAGLMQALGKLGISRQRIALLPSWDPSAAQLSHPLAAREWETWQRYPAPPPAPPPGASRDLGAGRWRQVFAPGCPIPVWPWQDRLKYLDVSGTKLFKFAGLGEPASAAAERSRQLARAGFSLKACEEGGGWISQPVLNSRALFFSPASRLLLEQWAEWVGDYLAWCAAQYRLENHALPSPELLEMLPTNCRLLLARNPRLPAPIAGPCCRLDGRMLAEEWGYAGGKFVKFDALDHGDDHFFPGPTDPAWDLAGIEVEFGPSLSELALHAYCRRSGDQEIRERLLWHRPAYAAFRAAFCAFAAQRTLPPDADWFIRRRQRYQRRLETYLRKYEYGLRRTPNHLWVAKAS